MTIHSFSISDFGFRIFLFCFVFLISDFGLATHIGAAEMSLAVSPPVTEILLAPNTPVQQTIFLKTNGADLTVMPELHRVTPSDDFGHVTVDPATINLSDLPFVVSSDPPLDTPITTQGDLELTLTFQALSSVAPTDSYLALVFRTVTPSPAPEQLDLTGSISALIFTSLAPSETTDINLELLQFDLPLLHDPTLPLTLSPVLHNQTSSMIRTRGSLTITSSGGSVLTKLELYPHLILGDASRQLQSDQNGLPADLIYQPKWYQFGPHRISLSVTTESGRTILESEKVIWFFPWRGSLLILTLLILLGLTLKYFHSRFKVV